MTSGTKPCLTGSVAVVTGSSRGIGYGIATALAKLGANVVITAKNAERLTAAAHEPSVHGPACEGMACNVTRLSAVDALATHVRHKYRHVDILVNNAGIGGPASLLQDLAPENWDDIFNTNVRGVFYMVRAFVPLMIASGSGHIINISSLAVRTLYPAVQLIPHLSGRSMDSRIPWPKSCAGGTFV